MGEIYEIRKGIPAPDSGDQPGLTKTFRIMDYMDSTVIPGNKIPSAHPCAAQVGIKIKTQKNDDGTFTIWRVDLPDMPQFSAAKASPPKIEATVANLDLDLPAGYYIQEDPYGPRIWKEGKPPATEPGPAATAETVPAAAESAGVDGTPDIFS
jgi:hypothetical protein